jgi:kynurenine/2-aminoadipate aminotransferase
MISNGTNHTIEVVTSLLMDRGDAILCEEYTYFYIIDSVAPSHGYFPCPVAVDQNGMCPESLRQVLEDMVRRGDKLPKLLYTVPCGQNPTGIATPKQRKQEIYRICQEFNLIILEDDAYYYLQYPGEQGEPGLQGLGPSYLSLDTDGRVVRMDSFSKLLAPGLRLGWVTAHPTMLDKMAMHLHASLNGPCGVTQVLLAELMHHWGSSGFERHCRAMQREYRRRSTVLHDAAVQELTGLAEWRRPAAGMFLWLKLLGVADADKVLERLKAQRVVLLPGRIAHCHGPRTPFGCPYLRLSFASASDEDMRTAMKRLASVLRALQP